MSSSSSPSTASLASSRGLGIALMSAESFVHDIPVDGVMVPEVVSSRGSDKKPPQGHQSIPVQLHVSVFLRLFGQSVAERVITSSHPKQT